MGNCLRKESHVTSGESLSMQDTHRDSLIEKDGPVQFNNANQVNKDFNSFGNSSTNQIKQEPKTELAEDRLGHISDREIAKPQRRQSLFVEAMATVSNPALGASMVSLSGGTSPLPTFAKRNGNSTRRRGNSTSTMYVDSTITQPQLDRTMRCVAIALNYHVIAAALKPPQFNEIFDQTKHSLGKSSITSDLDNKPLNDETIYIFIKTLFVSAALSAECAIITLVYVDRLIENTNLTLHPQSWKRVILGAILLASKVWDDQAVWNVDFITILPEATVEDLNKLEKTFLELLSFNVSVPASQYTKYYMDLLAVAESCKDLPPGGMKPLSQDEAKQLEAMTMGVEEKLALNHAPLRRSKSLENFEAKPAQAILS